MNGDSTLIPVRFPRWLDREAHLPPIPAHLAPFVDRYEPAVLPETEMLQFMGELQLGEKVEPEAEIDLGWDAAPDVSGQFKQPAVPSKPRPTEQERAADRAMRANPEWQKAQAAARKSYKDPVPWQVEFRLFEIAEAQKAWKERGR